MIVQQLHRIQEQHGYLPEHELRVLSERTGVHLYRLQEVSSFFPHFRNEPPPEVEVDVCRDISCQLRGACGVKSQLQRLGDDHGGRVRVEDVSCLGRCDRGPVVRVSHQATARNYCDRDVDELRAAVESTLAGSPPPHDTDVSWNERVGDDWKIDIYSQQVGDAPQLPPYAAVRKFLDAEDRYAVVKEIIDSLETAGLLGMGGAGGRTYKKWNDVYNAKGDVKYVVCNGDESEPGTFKDRELLLRAPHLVLEGLILGGLVVGAKQGTIYLRHEYEEQIEAMRAEIRRAEQLGVCGANILGSGIDFPVDTFVSPGGYICGEQTALIEAMEDKRAEPRNRPPELQTNGLHDCPTLLNNVETLAWTPAIILQDQGKWFADQGRGDFRGLRFFSISGDVQRPGVYETPIGLTLGELINDFAGGPRDGQVKAIALSGPSGGFLPRKLPVESLSSRFVETQLAADATNFDLLDMELDIKMSRAMGVMLGAGIIVYGENADMVAAAASASRFFRNESCGKCVPCRIGSQKLAELLTLLESGGSDAATMFRGLDKSAARSLVDELAETMKLTAICGLGMVAPNPFYTLLNHFPDEIVRYLGESKESK